MVYAPKTMVVQEQSIQTVKYRGAWHVAKVWGVIEDADVASVDNKCDFKELRSLNAMRSNKVPKIQIYIFFLHAEK